jgi:hypothetical protein
VTGRLIGIFRVRGIIWLRQLRGGKLPAARSVAQDPRAEKSPRVSPTESPGSPIPSRKSASLFPPTNKSPHHWRSYRTHR